jgi:hypothetical protein
MHALNPDQESHLQASSERRLGVGVQLGPRCVGGQSARKLLFTFCTHDGPFCLSFLVWGGLKLRFISSFFLFLLLLFCKLQGRGHSVFVAHNHLLKMLTTCRDWLSLGSVRSEGSCSVPCCQSAPAPAGAVLQSVSSQQHGSFVTQQVVTGTRIKRLHALCKNKKQLAS